MLSMKEVRESSRNGPYSKPLRVQVIAVGPPKSFTPAGSTEAKQMHYFSVAAQEWWMKATLYDSRKLHTIKEGAAIMLKNFIKRNDVLVVNDSTVVGKTSPVEVAQKTRDAAYSSIFPKSVKMAISELQAAAGSGLWTVVAKITKVGQPISKYFKCNC